MTEYEIEKATEYLEKNSRIPLVHAKKAIYILFICKRTKSDYHCFVSDRTFLNGVQDNTKFIGFSKLKEGTVLHFNIAIEEILSDVKNLIEREIEFERRNKGCYEKSIVDELDGAIHFNSFMAYLESIEK